MDGKVLAQAIGYISVVDDIISIKSADVVFAIGTDKVIPPADGDSVWKTLFSQLILTSDGYVWTCTKITKTDNSVEYSGKYCLGACSDFADVLELYALGDSNTIPPENGWAQSYTPTKGKWLWTKNELHFQNSTVITTDPICIGYFANDGINGTSFTPKGIAYGHFDKASSITEHHLYELYLLDQDDVSSPNKLYPCIAMFGRVSGAAKLESYKASAGDAYRIDTSLWVNNGTEWVNFGDIQGPQGEDGKGAIWAVLSRSQVTFESDKDGMVVQEIKSLEMRVIVGEELISPSDYNVSLMSCENFDSNKVTVSASGVNTKISIDSSGISSKKVADNFYMTCPYSSIRLKVVYDNYSLIVDINITVDTSVQDGYFHTSIDGLEAKYTTINNGVTKHEGLIQANSEQIKLTNSTVTAVNDRLTTYENAGIITQSNFAGLYAEYQENGKIVSKAEMNTSIEDGISKATINADQVNINANHMLNITGNYMTVDATNFKLDKSGNVSMSGEVNATSGKVAGMSISGNGLTNAGFNNDAYIILRNDNANAFAGIGANILPSETSMRAIARFANEDTTTKNVFGSGRNIAMLLSAKNSDYNMAFGGSGCGFLDGYISGYGFEDMTLSEKNTCHIILPKKSLLVIANHTEQSASIGLPKLSSIRTLLGVGSSEKFAVPIEIIFTGNKYNFIHGRNSYVNGMNTSEYPLTDYNEEKKVQYNTGIAYVDHYFKNGYNKFILIYDGSSYYAISAQTTLYDNVDYFDN